MRADSVLNRNWHHPQSQTASTWPVSLSDVGHINTSGITCESALASMLKMKCGKIFKKIATK